MRIEWMDYMFFYYFARDMGIFLFLFLFLFLFYDDDAFQILKFVIFLLFP